LRALNKKGFNGQLIVLFVVYYTNYGIKIKLAASLFFYLVSIAHILRASKKNRKQPFLFYFHTYIADIQLKKF